MIYKFSLCFLLCFSFIYAQKKTPPPQEINLFNKSEQSFILNGEFLYWTVHEGALDYAIRMKRPAWGPTPSFAQGDYEKANFDWKPGLRISAGYYRAPNFWEVTGEYTHLNVNGNTRTKRPPESGRFLTGTWPQIFQDPAQAATSHIHLHYNLADLGTNRVFHPFDNPHLRLRLAGGLTALWIHQNWKVRYFDIEENLTLITNRWRYWGLGLRAGIGFDWYWGCNIYMSGKYSMALVAGRYHNHAKQETNIAITEGDDPSVPLRDARYQDYRAAYSHQFFLGPSFQKIFCSTNRVECFLGYELTIWGNLQEVYRSTKGAPQEAKETWLNKGLILMHGLVARLTFNL